MSIHLLKLVNEIIRESEINLHGEKNEINELTRQISEKIKGHVPDSLKVLTFATIRLRDIDDHSNWAKDMFPKAEPYYFDDHQSVKDQYEKHMHKLRTEFPNVGFQRRSSTVVGALCEGQVGISMFEVRVCKSPEVMVDRQNVRILITSDVLKNNYDETHNALQQHWPDDPTRVDFAVYITMLSELLVKWDVVVIAANNIKRKGVDNKSGLAGAIFCFERGSDHDDFIVSLPAFFAPILQLVANAALLESTHHHHGNNKKNIKALMKLRPFIDTIKMMEHDILKAVGGCFGDDLARLYADLCFVNEGDDSLYALFKVSEMTAQRRAVINKSGVFHLKFDEYVRKKSEFESWLIDKFPEIYPHLEANVEFKRSFVDKFLEINDDKTWKELFTVNSTDSPLRKLFLAVGNKYIFLPHMEAMALALNNDFSDSCVHEIHQTWVTFTVSKFVGKGKKSDAENYLRLVSNADLLKAHFARSQYHPQLWLRFYGGSVTIEWKNANLVIGSIIFEKINDIPPIVWKEGEVATSFVTKYEV